MHVLLYFISIIGAVVLEPFESPCGVTDSECLERNFQQTAEAMGPGDPELGIEPTDPLRLDYIDGKLPVLDFEFTDSTLTGLKECTYKNLSITEDASRLRVQYDCPRISLAGRYKVSTSFFFITSRGDYTMNTGRYLVNITSDLKNVTNNGSSHLQLGDFSLKCQLLGTLDLALRRTDSTSPGLLKMANQYMRDNYKTVAASTQDTVWSAIVRKQHDILNQYLLTRPVEQLLIL